MSELIFSVVCLLLGSVLEYKVQFWSKMFKDVKKQIEEEIND
jgi:hypothetical protein